MKALIGLAFALLGMVAGFTVAATLAYLGAIVFQVSSREGAAGYLILGVGLLGAIAGLVAGLVWYARTAPQGHMLGHFGQGVIGVVVLVALIGAGLWAWLETREVPVRYNGDTMASLRLEFRLPKAMAEPGPAREWLSVEVTTSGTRPEAQVLQDAVRVEGEHLVIPAIQGPLIRSANRLVVARVGRGPAAQDEIFSPPMPRKPDPAAGWSEWAGPVRVQPRNEARGPSAARLEMRWRIELYGQ